MTTTERLPSVSACVPVFEVDPAVLSETLAAIARATGPSVALDIRIQDDASRTDYRPLVAGWNGAVPLRYVRNPDNLGMAANWNQAVRGSGGEYVMVIGQDDLIHPDLVTTLVDRLERRPEVMLASTGRRFMTEDGRRRRGVPVTDRAWFHEGTVEAHLRPEEVREGALAWGNVIGEPSSVLFRRQAFDRIDGFSSAYHHAADLDAYLRMAELGGLYYVNRPLVSRRLAAGSLTGHNLRSGAVSRERLHLYLDHRSTSGLSGEADDRARSHLVVGALADLVRGGLRRRPGQVRAGWTLLREVEHVPVAAVLRRLGVLARRVLVRRPRPAGRTAPPSVVPAPPIQPVPSRTTEGAR